MANEFAAPSKNKPTGTYITPEEGMWDAWVFDGEKVPNPFYAAGEPEYKKWQIKWTLYEFDDSLGDLPDGSEPDAKWSNRLTYFTGIRLGWHKKNKLTGFLRVADPDFVYDEEANGGDGEMTSYSDLDAMIQAVVRNPVRVITTHNVKRTEDGVKTYQQIDKVLGSKHAQFPMADFIAMKLGSDTVTESGVSEEIPF
jgi:hypothetical protein